VRPNYVAAVAGESRDGFGLAFIDVTTGDFRATEAATTEGLLDELARVDPRELLLPRGHSRVGSPPALPAADHRGRAWEPSQGSHINDLATLIRRAYPRLAQTPINIDDEPEPISAWPTGLAGLGSGGAGPRPTGVPGRQPRAALRARNPALRAPAGGAPGTVSARRILVIDEQARSHLELTETMLERKRQGSLLDTLDVTATAMGGRLLRRWLLFPLLDLARIRRRHDAIERLVEKQSAREASRKILSELGDIERLVSRARLGVASPRDVVVLGRSLQQLPDLAAALQQAVDPLAALAADGAGSDLLDLGRDLRKTSPIVSSPRWKTAHLPSQGRRFHPLRRVGRTDELRAIASGGRDQILAIEARERERTGIASLKVKYNSVFGYYIEITRAHLANVPADYTRKQTVANAERFVTAELADYEAKILGADERRVSLELTLFSSLRDQVGAAAARVLALAGRVAAADVVAALAEQAHHHGYCRPVVDDSEVLELWTADTRWWNGWQPPAALCPTTCAWIPSASRFSS